MSIIIRLQNLPWSANALDIRQYFAGLQIPEGGVHIVGGELGDAFIAFSTDEDARQAFLRSDGKIKSVQIKLMLSSRTEMQRVIEQARTQSMAAFMLPANTPVAAPLPAAVPPVIPAAVPEIKRDSKERDSDRSRKDRRRSRTRSKSRDRRDRSRDRKDRRHRDRSRSRSRDRRDRRRRNRSSSRNRSRDKETRRRDKAKSPKRDEREDNASFQRDSRKPIPEIWANRPAVSQSTLNIIPPSSVNEGPGILGAYPMNMDPSKRNIMDNMGVNLQNRGLNGFQGNNQIREQGFGVANQPSVAPRVRESWPPANVIPAGALPVALSTPQRRNLGNSFGRSTDISQAPQGNINRGPREDLRNEFNTRERERPERDQKPQRTPDNRNESAGKKSRFEDIDASPVNACISIEPFYGSYVDLRRFFQGLSINYRGIKIINDEYGYKTGVCFVQFRDTYTKEQALKRNGQKLNNTQVKIQHISDKSFEEAIDRFNPRTEEDKHEDQFGRSRNITKTFNNKPVAPEEFQLKDFVCLQVEDLPSFVKEQDILHIFSQHPLISLHLDVKPKGGTIAYVKFSSKEVAKQALAEKSHHVIRGKAVLVKPCKDEVFDEISKEQNADLEELKPADIGTDCLSISKLPSKTNDRDISDFFSDIGVIPTKIHLMSNNLGFTGQAYCEFETKDEASKAATKNNTVLGPHTISVTPISRTEMEAILNSSLPHPGITPGLPLAPGTPLPPIKVVSPPKTVPPIKAVSPIKPLSFNKPEPVLKSEPIPDIKPVLPESIDESVVKLPMPPKSPQNPQPVPESPKNPSPVRTLMAEKSQIVVGPENPEKLNVPSRGADTHENFNGPRGGLDNQDFNGPRGGPGNRENFNGPVNRDNFNGPRERPDHREHFNGPRGGPGPRETRFGPRGGPRFNDDGSRFNPRMDEGPRFNSRMDDGPRFNPRGEDGPGFNPRGDDGPRFNPRRDKGRYNPHMDDGNLEDVPGCTVYMENVPYKAGTNEILDFFEGYNCTNNVSRRYNPNNTPSAEAKVTFYTPEDAFRAIRELHGAKIWGRPIYLRQA